MNPFYAREYRRRRSTDESVGLEHFRYRSSPSSDRSGGSWLRKSHTECIAAAHSIIENALTGHRIQLGRTAGNHRVVRS